MGRRSKSHTLEAAVEPQHRELLRHVGPEETRRWIRWLAPSLVALVTLAAFLPTLHNQFVNWDDDVNFLDNPHYRGLGWSQGGFFAGPLLARSCFSIMP